MNREKESEGAEVKKNIEWLKSAIQQNLDFYNDNDEEWQMAKVRAYAKSLDLINQLDEPEVLSQEWIDEHKERWQDLSITGYSVPEKDLQNLLVPKQEDMFNGQTPEEGEVYFAVGFDGAVEISVARSIDEAIETLTEYGTNYTIIGKPVIPQFVADYIEKQKEFGYSFLLAYEIISDSNKRNEADEKLVDYIQKNQDDFVRAWYGYEIEQEPQYRIKTGSNYLYFSLDGTVRGATKNNAVISKERLEELPFDVEMAVLSGIIEVEELEE